MHACAVLLQVGKITVHARRLEDHIEISVEDTGIGVCQEQLEAILQPSEQVRLGQWGELQPLLESELAEVSCNPCWSLSWLR